jgi:hypothetical protein
LGPAMEPEHDLRGCETAIGNFLTRDNISRGWDHELNQ